MLFMFGLIPPHLLRIVFSIANVFQIKLYNFLYVLNTYTDVIKTTKYFELLYKYSTQEKLDVLKTLNQQADTMVRSLF